MMSVKTKTAEALFPLLSIFHEMSGLSLKAVRQSEVEDELIGIEFDFESKVLIIRANGEDDTVELSSVESSIHKLSAGGSTNLDFPWRSSIGKEFGWGWVIVNQQGYLDGIALCFGGITPQFLITVVASSLKVSQIGAPVQPVTAG
jgi:hypothetical protein